MDLDVCQKCGTIFAPSLIKPLTICDKCADSLTVEIEEKIALAKENKTFEGVTDGDQFLFEATAITESPDKAKERYEAAISYLNEYAFGYYGKNEKWNYFENDEHVQQALKIAAGIQ